MSKHSSDCEIFEARFSGNAEMPFVVSLVYRPNMSLGLFRDKDLCLRCCQALNRSVQRIIRSWHLKEYERGRFDDSSSAVSNEDEDLAMDRTFSS